MEIYFPLMQMYYIDILLYSAHSLLVLMQHCSYIISSNELHKAAASKAHSLALLIINKCLRLVQEIVT